MPIPTQEKNIDEFADQLMGMLNQGALSLMVSIGHRTGLFDALAELPASTLEEIASHTGLNSRYVKEWLGAMVSGEIVTYEPGDQKYRLPETHAALLTRSASPDNIAVFAQYIGLLGQVEDKIIDCFREGGGVGYEHFPRFHEVMADDSGQTVLAALDEHILPLISHLIPALDSGIRVLDIGCGRGRALLHLAARFPNSEFVGYELSEEALTYARGQAMKRGLSNVRFVQRNLTGFKTAAEPEAFDLVTAFDAIHDQATPQSVLNGIYKTLKRGGTFLMQDIHASSHLENNLDHPIAPLLYTISTMHCMTVSLANNGAGLGTMWGEELALEMLKTAGFTDVGVHQLDHDIQNSFYIMQKS
ncbi:MAG: methyltransferase domain-containing protein [Candidatus Thiodiazotropha sp. (ex Monitilora ramsayi)]|nr:methyltransferase domain-containing protein [Candidatus Thiodiazotropha sp. (ex Monitilora ramsayi)]